MRVGSHPYEDPTVEDYGDLLSMTQGGELLGQEDGGTKLSFLDVSDGMLP
ncbi:MAG: hypothetical protein WD844_14680 [Thermoleophilaceae bacterium]